MHVALDAVPAAMLDRLIDVQGVPMVMDADGIAVIEDMIDKTPGDNPFKDVRKAVLTPNAPEFWRLCQACHIEHGKMQPHDDPSLVQV